MNLLLSEITGRLQVQSQQQEGLTRNTYYSLTFVPGHGKQNWNNLTHESNKEFSSRFGIDSRVQHESPEKGRKRYRLKRCEYNNEDLDKSISLALAGPSGIRAGWGIEINGRFEAERSPASAGPPSGWRAATLIFFPPWIALDLAVQFKL